MSTDEIRTAVESYAAAWQAGDRAAIASLYRADFTLHYAGSNDLTGVHRGKVASLRVMAEFGARSRRRLVSIDDVAIGRDRGVLFATESLAFGDGRVEVARVLVYRVEAGLLVECWVYDEDQSTIDAIIGLTGNPMARSEVAP